MLRAYLPGLVLATAVVAAAIVAYATLGGGDGPPRPAWLAEDSEGPELRLPPGETPPRSSRDGAVVVAIGIGTGLRVAPSGGVAAPRAGTPPSSSGSSTARGVSHRAGGGTPVPRASTGPVNSTPAPVASATPVPAQATPAAGADEPRVRAPEVAAKPEQPDDPGSDGSDDTDQPHGKQDAGDEGGAELDAGAVEDGDTAGH